MEVSSRDLCWLFLSHGISPTLSCYSQLENLIIIMLRFLKSLALRNRLLLDKFPVMV